MINKLLELVTNSYRLRINGILVIVSKKPTKVVKISKLHDRSHQDIYHITRYLVDEGFLHMEGPVVCY